MQPSRKGRRPGFNPRMLDKVFSTVSYSRSTISADRGQKSFKLSFDQFMQKRGGQTIINRGKTMKKNNAALFARIEQRYGVPAGPLIAIWGMETGFGSFLGKEHTLSAVATLAFDCRRSEFFTDQFYAALELVQAGNLDVNAKGAPMAKSARHSSCRAMSCATGRTEMVTVISTWCARAPMHSLLRRISCAAMAGSRAQAISRVSRILRRSRAGMPPRSTSRRLPISVLRSTPSDHDETAAESRRSCCLVQQPNVQFATSGSRRMKSCDFGSINHNSPLLMSNHAPWILSLPRSSKILTQGKVRRLVIELRMEMRSSAV